MASSSQSTVGKDAERRARKDSMTQSMLIIHQGALGDFILALPSLKVLRTAFPQARLTIMGYPRILELVEKRYYADEIVSVDQKGMASFYVRGGELDPSLSQFFSSMDLIVIFGKDGEGSVSKNLKRVCGGRILHIHPFPPWNEKTHMTDHLLRELRRHHFVVNGENPQLYLTDGDRRWGVNFCHKKGLTEEEKRNAVLLHPGSGSKRKVWPLERFVDLVRYLGTRLDSRLLIVLGPAEGEEIQKAFEKMEWDLGLKAPLLVRDLSLLGLASVMEGCRLYVGNDSGITHMATALGLPTVAIFGPTDPMIWSPRGENVVVVRSGTDCSPCSQEVYLKCTHFNCLKRVTVQGVLEGIKKLGMLA